MGKRIYLAGGLFNAGERLHNLYLERELAALGYEVILPQREALNFFEGKEFDTTAISNACVGSAKDLGNIFVGCLDGPDANSGMAVEYGCAIARGKHVVVYRTDFRTEPEKEIGVNAMFKAGHTTLVYEPCYFTDLDEVEEYYQRLARAIDEAIKQL